jgi:hypothetical protein
VLEIAERNPQRLRGLESGRTLSQVREGATGGIDLVVVAAIGKDAQLIQKGLVPSTRDQRDVVDSALGG